MLFRWCVQDVVLMLSKSCTSAGGGSQSTPVVCENHLAWADDTWLMAESPGHLAIMIAQLQVAMGDNVGLLLTPDKCTVARTVITFPLHRTCQLCCSPWITPEEALVFAFSGATCRWTSGIPQSGTQRGRLRVELTTRARRSRAGRAASLESFGCFTGPFSLSSHGALEAVLGIKTSYIRTRYATLHIASSTFVRGETAGRRLARGLGAVYPLRRGDRCLRWYPTFGCRHARGGCRVVRQTAAFPDRLVSIVLPWRNAWWRASVMGLHWRASDPARRRFERGVTGQHGRKRESCLQRACARTPFSCHGQTVGRLEDSGPRPRRMTPNWAIICECSLRRRRPPL